MEKKKLGKTKLFIPPVVFGGNVFGWTLNQKESFRLLDQVYERGFTAIDTADSYSHWAPGNSGGESEAIIGKWLKERGVRDEITLITKVGSNPGKEFRDLSKGYILTTIEESLQRLQTDHIDLYFTHWDDPKIPVEETLEAYQKLMQDGKVRYIGASNLSPERLEESLEASRDHGFPRYDVFQPEYNLIERKKFEGKIRDICERNDLGVITYFSLASGFLTGKYRSKEDLQGEDRQSMVKNYATEKGFEILKAVEQIAGAHNVSNSAVALQWIIQRPGVTAPIASATKEDHLKSFDEAVNFQLSEEEMNRLNEVSE